MSADERKIRNDLQNDSTSGQSADSSQSDRYENDLLKRISELQSTIVEKVANSTRIKQEMENVEEYRRYYIPEDDEIAMLQSELEARKRIMLALSKIRLERDKEKARKEKEERERIAEAERKAEVERIAGTTTINNTAK